MDQYDVVEMQTKVVQNNYKVQSHSRYALIFNIWSNESLWLNLGLKIGTPPCKTKQKGC